MFFVVFVFLFFSFFRGGHFWCLVFMTGYFAVVVIVVLVIAFASVSALSLM